MASPKQLREMAAKLENMNVRLNKMIAVLEAEFGDDSDEVRPLYSASGLCREAAFLVAEGAARKEEVA